MVVIAVCLKDLVKGTFSKKGMESGDAKCEQIDLEKKTMIPKSKKQKKSEGPMKDKSCKKCFCILRMAFAFLIIVGIGVIFYLYSDQFVLQHTVQGGQKYKVGHCFSFPRGELPNGRFLMLCFTKHGNSAISIDKGTQKSDVMRKFFERGKFN